MNQAHEQGQKVVKKLHPVTPNTERWLKIHRGPNREARRAQQAGKLRPRDVIRAQQAAARSAAARSAAAHVELQDDPMMQTAQPKILAPVEKPLPKARKAPTAKLAEAMADAVEVAQPEVKVKKPRAKKAATTDDNVEKPLEA